MLTPLLTQYHNDHPGEGTATGRRPSCGNASPLNIGPRLAPLDTPELGAAAQRRLWFNHLTLESLFRQQYMNPTPTHE